METQFLPELLRSHPSSEMPPAHFLSPTAPGPPAVTLLLNMTESLTFDLFLPTTPGPTPAGEVYLQLHSVLIVAIFSVVCLLLLVAFFYAFCFRCSIQPSPKAPRRAPRRASLDPEDATYRRSSSDAPSVGNAV
ncbi:unnamed protein product [Gadus morhua 'NCC']